jgi:lysophospholipase L1-like esterase
LTTKRHLAAPRDATLFQPPYGPDALQTAYDLPSSANGQGQTVAIVDAFDYPNLDSDLELYRNQYGLATCNTANGCFTKLNQDGQQGNYPSYNAGWAGEEVLDVDMVSAICPNCHITVVEANSTNSADLNAAENTAVASGAKFISNSWGGPSPITGSVNGPWASHPGVVITASTGDSGYGVSYPAAYTNTVAVGGTSLLPAANDRGWAEIAWTAGGSGCSSESKPSWQADTGCTGHTVADVSAVADPYTGVNIYDSDPNGPTMGWGQIGGTSASSPIIAAAYALAGDPGTNAGAAVMYGPGHPGMLNDIVSGINAINGCTPAYLCTAGPGYDGPTGLGTPNGIGVFTVAPPDYTSMGDSYSAGEGTGNYDPVGTNANSKGCHRSPSAFGRVYAATLNVTIDHIACSGAIMPNITTTGQNGELPQIDQLNPETRLVTVTIGGNDAGFADVLKTCIKRTYLSLPIFYPTCQSYYSQNDSNNLDNKIDGLRPQLAAVYTEIRNKAPNAEIVAVTYPNIFSYGNTCAGITGLLVSDVNWLWTETGHLDDVIVAATRDAGISQLDLRAIFVGHQLCDADPWVYSIPIPVPTDTQSWDTRGWFHPTVDGQAAMAQYLQQLIGPPPARPANRRLPVPVPSLLAPQPGIRS